MFGLGYIDSAALSNIKTFYSVKEDESEGENIQSYRGGDNALFVSNKSAKAEISLDMDYISDTDYNYLRSILLNRLYPNKVYFREPGYFTGALLTPSTATNKAYKLTSAQKYPALATVKTTEFTSGDYTGITGFSTPMSYTSAVDDYIHFGFTFDLTQWLTVNTLSNLLRISLFMQTPAAYRVNISTPVDLFGIIVYAYNVTSAAWVEFYRRSITLTVANQQCAGIRPTINYTNIADFVDGNNKVTFMVSTLQPRAGQGISTLAMNYTACLVNGFMVRRAEDFNMNWTNAFTGAGRSGQLRLSEV
jgi:hypothetical protein